MGHSLEREGRDGAVVFDDVGMEAVDEIERLDMRVGVVLVGSVKEGCWREDKEGSMVTAPFPTDF